MTFFTHSCGSTARPNTSARMMMIAANGGLLGIAARIPLPASGERVGVRGSHIRRSKLLPLTPTLSP